MRNSDGLSALIDPWAHRNPPHGGVQSCGWVEVRNPALGVVGLLGFRFASTQPTDWPNQILKRFELQQLIDFGVIVD